MIQSATAGFIPVIWVIMSDDGFLYVLGRFKSLLIADDGEKFSPKGLKKPSANSQSISTSACCTITRNVHQCTAVSQPACLKVYLEDRNMSATTEEGKRAVLNLIENEVNEYRINGKYGHMFPHTMASGCTGVLNESFNEENGMMNSTMKIVRGKITERYQELIEWLYTPDGQDSLQRTQHGRSREDETRLSRKYHKQMKRFLIPVFIIIAGVMTFCSREKAPAWQPADNPLITEWGEKMIRLPHGPNTPGRRWQGMNG